MDSEIIIRDRGRSVVLEAKGRFTLGPATDLIRRTVLDVMLLGKRYLIVNLRHVTQLDSSAVGELVAAWDTVSAYGGELKLASVSKHVDDVLTSSRLHMLFDVFEDDEAAIQSIERSLERRERIFKIAPEAVLK